MAAVVKRIVRVEKTLQVVKVVVSGYDYDREDDVKLDDGRVMTEPHKRTFREVIDKAHEGAFSYFKAPRDADIINVEFYDSGGVQPEWHFYWRYMGYPTPAQVYRKHVNACPQCASAEERARVSDHRCEVGQKLFDTAMGYEQ